VFELLERRN